LIQVENYRHSTDAEESLNDMALCFSGRKMCVKILKTLERKEVAPQGDDLRTFLSDFVAALPHIEMIGELSL
jgi:hypothetical protein